MGKGFPRRGIGSMKSQKQQRAWLLLRSEMTINKLKLGKRGHMRGKVGKLTTDDHSDHTENHEQHPFNNQESVKPERGPWHDQICLF